MNTKATDMPLSQPTTRLHWYHWLVVVSSLLLTFGAWYVSSKQAEDKTAEQFKFQSNQIIQLVKERMEKYEEALWAGVAVLHTEPEDMGRDQWGKFANSLSIDTRYPGINGIGVIHYVEPAALAEYLAWQREILPNYKVHPSHDKNELWPITYIEPIEMNLKALGLDMAHEVSRHAAAIKARDTGVAQITGPINLVQDAKKTPGFLLYAPWYTTPEAAKRKTERVTQFIGLVYAPFIMKNLMSGTLTNENRLVNFSIHDENIELYNEFTSASEDYDPSPLHASSEIITLYGRHWKFSIHSSMLFREQHIYFQPLIILLGGLTIDAMLLALFLILASANKRAVNFAQKTNENLLENQSQLNDSNERLNSAMNTMMDGLVVISDKGIIIEVNQTILTVFGYTREQLISKNVKCLMPNPFSEEHDEYLSRYAQTGIAHVLNKERQLLAKRADGSVFPMRLSVNKGINDKGVFYTGVIHDLSDLTESQALLTQSESILNAAMKNSTSGFLIIDKERNFIEANSAICQWLGYSRIEMLSFNVLDIIAQDAIEKTNEDWGFLLQGKKVNFEQVKQYKHKNGSLHWGLVSVSIVEDEEGDPCYSVAQIIDIDKLKKLERELQEQNKLLSDANEELKQFTYIASHDLKEPLRTLRTFAGYLLKDVSAEKWKRVAEDVYHVENAAERMTHLIDDLLELSHTSNAEFVFSSVSSDELIDVVKMNLKALLHDNNGEINVFGDSFVFLGDKGQLVQALQNLISNGIKFHKVDEPAIIEIIFQRSLDPNTGTIIIKDNGIGIAEEHLKNIFLAFKRLHGPREYQGTGIGLAIVKKVIDRHDGAILVDSVEGEGSCFTLTLPLFREDDR